MELASVDLATEYGASAVVLLRSTKGYIRHRLSFKQGSGSTLREEDILMLRPTEEENAEGGPKKSEATSCRSTPLIEGEREGGKLEPNDREAL